MRTFFAVAIVTATLLIPQLCLAGDPQLVFNVQRQGKSKITPVKVITDANGDIDGLLVDKDRYSAAQLGTETLIHIDGVKDSDKVLYLNGSRVDLKTGGNLTMRYLHDGVKGKYNSLTLNLSRDEKGTWVVKVNGRVIKALNMTNNDVFLLGTIGIDAVNPAYAYYANSPQDSQSVASIADSGFSPEKLSDAPAVKFVNTSTEAPDGGTPALSDSGKIPLGT